MVAARFNILGFFYDCNKKYFNGVLPMPKLDTMSSHRTFGQFECSLDAYGRILNPIIKISNVYDYTVEQFESLIVHEMIHYYLAYTGEDMRCRHGKAFKKMAKDFNLKYGLNITSTIDDFENYKLKEGQSKFWHTLRTLL